MKTKEAAKKAGNKNQLAILLGITRQAVNSWGDDVPQNRIWQLRVLRPEWFKGKQKNASISKL